MSDYLNKIKDKRLQAEAAKREAENASKVTNILQSNQKMAETLAKRAKSTPTARREKLLNAFNEAMKNDDVLATEQHKELIKAVTEVKQALREAAQKTEAQTKALQDSISDTLATIKTAYAEAADQQANALNGLVKQLKSTPRPLPPVVSLTERELDLTPIAKAVKEAVKGNQTPKQGINLNDFKAIDLDNAPDGTQYIGFENSTGQWYIMQNDDTNNTIRYYFGAGDYERAWNMRIGHEYKKLSEAVK